MSKDNSSHRSRRRRQKQERNLRIRSVRRDPPDLKKLAGALIELAQAQAEAEAAAEHARKQATRHRREGDDGDEEGAA
jgi:hypothetical protein